MQPESFLDGQPSPRAAPTVRVDQMQRPDTWTFEFRGFGSAAFRILDRLRETPHIDQYQDEKPGVTDDLKDPFRRYRDDLVVQWVLPNRLDFETERHVFSRLLKNDFGAGGCHDNLWMAFYRPETKRLKDVQISHRISPDGFDIGIYVGSHAKDLLQQARSRIDDAPETYLDLINPLIGRDNWRFSLHGGSGDRAWTNVWTAPLDEMPDDLARCKGIWVRRRIGRERVLDLGPELVKEGVNTVMDVWPIYRFYLA
ncbi:hypothetical protein CRI94_01745 [Longibacter salinarum]|uniref:Uncharacterized protein n=1 Tax=Longibacter salinarum TaxID=1850348 RepID=A0A2A8D287_9BACT|nr:hypothetical protein [Longibacter salinarum]PEN15036.1 hypothetical protein CRI94_01745 [Longibacter salinarum]